MKNYKKILLPLICLTLLFSCDKDSDSDNTDNNTQTNYVLYDNNYYDLGGPFLIEDYGQYSDDLYNLDISIHSPNVYFDGEDVSPYDTLANGYYLYFELFSSEMMLESGTYSFNLTPSSMSFDIGYFEVFNLDDELLSAVFTSGTINLNINSENSSATIDVEGTSNTNKDISAHWEGNYNYIDWSDLINSEQDFKKKTRINL